MAWPTMRLLKSLTDGWADVSEKSKVVGGDWKNLPLLSELGHPAVEICQDVESNPNSPKYELHRAASSAAGYRVIEAKDRSVGAGWRSAIIQREDVSWIVFADKHDRFHKTVADRFGADSRIGIEPTDQDIALRKLKLAEVKTQALVGQWKRELIEAVLNAFKEAFELIPGGGEVVCLLPYPPASLVQPGAQDFQIKLVVSVTAEYTAQEIRSMMDGDHADTVLAGISLKFDAWKTLGGVGEEGSPLQHILLQTVLPVLDMREETWDKEPSAYYGLDGSLNFDIEMTLLSAMQIVYAAENTGSPSTEVAAECARSNVGHFVTRQALFEALETQKPLRAVCGYWFVPSRFPDQYPVCSDCGKQRSVQDFFAKRQ